MYEKDFHFYQDLSTALENGDIFVMTGFKTLPYEGGWLDQDWAVAQDLLTYMQGYVWANRINHPRQGKQDDFDPLNMELKNPSTEVWDMM